MLLAACGPQEADVATAAATATTTAAPTSTTAPATTPAAPTPTATTPAATTPVATTPPPVPVPALTGLPVARARAALAALGLRVRTTSVRTARYAAGTVVSQSHGTDRRLNRGSVVTLQVAVAPPPAPRPSPAPAPPPAPEPEPEPEPACHPSYAGACLDPGASDYDCAGGSGNGPKYTGRVTVVGPDVFDLDRDGDGIGCEKD